MCPIRTLWELCLRISKVLKRKNASKFRYLMLFPSSLSLTKIWSSFETTPLSHLMTKNSCQLNSRTTPCLFHLMKMRFSLNLQIISTEIWIVLYSIRWEQVNKIYNKAQHIKNSNKRDLTKFKTWKWKNKTWDPTSFNNEFMNYLVIWKILNSLFP